LANSVDKLLERKTVLAAVSKDVIVERRQVFGVNVPEVAPAELPQFSLQRRAKGRHLGLEFPSRFGDQVRLAYSREWSIKFTEHQPPDLGSAPQANNLSRFLIAALLRVGH
jgi:hypothetical protein